MKTGYRTAMLGAVWTLAVILGQGLLYTYSTDPRPVTEREWVDAESSISFRGLTPVKIGGCDPFRLQSLDDPTIVVTPEAETPSPDSRCVNVAYHLETRLTGKWRVHLYGATLVIAPQGTGSAVTVERGEAGKRTILVASIFATVCLWAGTILFVSSFMRWSSSRTFAVVVN